MAVHADDLVGRAGELGWLEDAATRVERQGFVAAEIAGEPGIGKTRLLAELADRADRRGHLVLAGAASELEADLPFWVFADALDEYVHGLPPQQLETLGEDVKAELAHVLPSLAAAPTGATAPAIERYRAHRAVRALLELLAEHRPVVVVLDDLHWADSGSLELLGSLLRRPPTARVLLVMAMRPRQAPPLLVAPLERARRAGTLDRIELAGLSEHEARALLGDGVDDESARRLFAESGGNPFYLEQLARATGRAGGARDAATLSPALAGLDVPPGVAASLTEEIAVLAPVTRRVLAGAAVAGDPFEPELAAAAGEVIEDEAIAALDELLERDLVRPTDVPRRFRFRHPLIRGAAYSTAPGGWRLGAHERTARALAERGAPAAARAHHVEYAARHGDAAAVKLLAQAGREVLHRTPAGAVRWFGAALRLLPAAAPAEERVALLLALAAALAATGRFDEAREAVLEGLDLSPADATEQRIELVAACSVFDTLKGEHLRAQRRLEAALDAYDQAPASVAVALMLRLSDNAVWRMDFEQARDWAAKAYERAAPLGDRRLQAVVVAAHAIASALSGAIAEGQRLRDEAAAALDLMSDTEVAPSIMSLSNLASAELYLDHMEAGAARSARTLAVARATNQGQLYPMLAPLRGIYLSFLGRLEEARALLDGACESGRLGGDSHALAWGLFARALAARPAGDLEAAIADGAEAVALARRSDVHNVVSLFGGLALGVALLERGDSEWALEAMLEAAGGASMPFVPGGWRAYYLDRLVHALLEAGRRDEAATAAVEAQAVAEATGLGIATLGAKRAGARIALDRGDAEAAAREALASANSADRLGMPVEAGLSRLLGGMALASAGRPDQAMGALDEAATAFDRCGALRYRAAADRELRRLGSRNVHRRTRAGRQDGSGPESLTERERQVAMLIVDRRTNPQIAAALFLSPKTVETHVRNLFHKLGVSSRVEVARVMERVRGP